MRKAALVVMAIGLTVSSVAEAQWVLLARRAVGRVEQMSQQAPDGASSDTAAVILEAPANKIYDTALRSIKAAQGITITSEDAAKYQIQFTNGAQSAGMKVSPLGDKLSHMLITSVHTGSQPNAALLVMNAVMRVCGEMKVQCEPAGTGTSKK